MSSPCFVIKVLANFTDARGAIASIKNRSNLLKTRSHSPQNS
ncbi:hypothetical protein [Trichocoleus sp. FACHB-90]|nr:hypothetical protein [Trichocoleus sp. FACHB-90]